MARVRIEDSWERKAGWYTEYEACRMMGGMSTESRDRWDTDIMWRLGR